MKTKYVATYGLLIALAFLLSYLESIIPIPIPIPGIKLGLANLVVVAGLYMMGPKDAFILSIIRVVLVGFTFGNLSTMLFSLSGGILSCLLMIAFHKVKFLSMTGVSIIGGIAHNIGQILVAAWLVQNALLMAYLPFLLISGALTGTVIGMISSMIVERVKRSQINH